MDPIAALQGDRMHIHTDAIKQNLIPAALTKQQMSVVYANEADVLNMESLNSVLINDGVSQSERLQKLNQIAISQMTVLESVGENKLLK